MCLNPNKKKIFELVKLIPFIFFRVLMFFLIYFVLLRIVELFIICESVNFNIEIIKEELLGFSFDIHIALIYCAIFVLPVYFLYCINNKIINYLFFTCALLLSILNLLLIEYFKIARIPLDDVIFNYSIKELLYISFSSSSSNTVLLLSIYIIIGTVILFASIKLTKQIKVDSSIILISFIIVLTAIFFRKYSHPDNDFSMNKVEYFFRAIIRHPVKLQQAEISKSELKRITNDYHKFHQNEIYLDNEYPFYKRNNSSKVLAPYFTPNINKPNIVIIIVESLGKAISGKDASVGSFTPFLDSLEQHSLSWDNFLCNSERTFGVLPGVLGSLTYGRECFLKLGNNMPNHLSLLKILQRENYYSSFFYGGITYFDNMDMFLKKNGIDFIFTEFDEYTKDHNKSEIAWGFGDKYLFNRSLNIKDTLCINQPFIDIYLTLSIHSPWMLDEKEKYNKKADARIKELQKNGNYNEGLLLKKDILPCILYTDDALKEYFSSISKREYFKNTIFIITGDHRVEHIKDKSEIDAFHVPLIIYSPLLINTGKFKGISSAQSITPTILGLLENQFNYRLENVHWLEGELDTSIFFQSKCIHPLMRTNKDIRELVMGKYLLSYGNLMLLNDGMYTQKIENDSLKDIMNNYLIMYKTLDYYATEQNRLLPVKDNIFGKN